MILSGYYSKELTKPDDSFVIQLIKERTIVASGLIQPYPLFEDLKPDSNASKFVFQSEFATYQGFIFICVVLNWLERKMIEVL